MPLSVPLMDHEAEIARLNGVVADRDKMLAKAIDERDRLLTQLREVRRVLKDERGSRAREMLEELLTEVLPTSETDPW